MKKLLTIDYSTTSTGWAFWDIDSKQLEDFGVITPLTKGLNKISYPKKQLIIMQDLAQKIGKLIGEKMPDSIVIEEVNRGISRISQKTLDGGHWILLDRLLEEELAKVRYIDSDGFDGWRSVLKLRLTEMDKKLNAERRKINSKRTKGTKELPIINKKHLAARYVNTALGLNFDVDLNSNDNDIVDAIGIGLAVLEKLQ